jgi:cyclic beta-1,2-glucan synthetase
MDFVTRNLYRTAIEQMARGTHLTEPEIARRAVAAASSSPGTCDGDSRRHDPGYHLIGGGRPAFERALGFRPPGLALRRRFIATGIAGYVVCVFVTATVVLCLPLLVLVQVNIASVQIVSMVLIGLLPALDAALMLVNRAITSGFGATLLPGFDLLQGVPMHLRTLVAIPTMLTTRTAVDEQVQRLEVHYLSNPAGAIHFALLSDWTDAISQCGRHRTLPSIPPAPCLQRSAGSMDGMGAQARQTPRTQSPAARRHRYDVRRREPQPGKATAAG